MTIHLIKKGKHHSVSWFRAFQTFHWKKRKASYVVNLHQNCLYVPKTDSWQKIAGFCPYLAVWKIFSKKGRPPHEYYSVRVAYRVATGGIQVALYAKIKGKYHILPFEHRIKTGEYHAFEVGIEGKEVYMLWKNRNERRSIKWDNIPSGLGYNLFPYFEDGKPNKHGAAPHDMTFHLTEIK